MKPQKEISLAHKILREKETSVCIHEKGFPDRWIVDTTEDEVVERMKEYAEQQNKELKEAILKWWEENQYLVTQLGDGDEMNVFDEEPEFVKLVKV